MTPEQGKAFLKCLGVDADQVRSNGWMMARCPLSKWTHKHHQDKTPSFGLNIGVGKRTGFHCFACLSGYAETLLQTFEMYAVRDGVLKDFDIPTARLLLDDDLEVVPLPEYQDTPLPPQVFQPWPSYWLESFTPLSHVPEAVTYLKDRGVRYESMKAHRLMYDPSKFMVVCPYFDVFHRFAGARGRSINPDAEGIEKHYDYTFQKMNNAGLVWYNEPVLELPGPVVVVEGQFDCWRVELVWPKVVANLTAKFTEYKLRKLCSATMIIHIPDPDEAGIQSNKQLREYGVSKGVPVKTVHLPPVDEHGKKVDPAVCHEDYLHDQICAVL